MIDGDEAIKKKRKFFFRGNCLEATIGSISCSISSSEDLPILTYRDWRQFWHLGFGGNLGNYEKAFGERLKLVEKITILW